MKRFFLVFSVLMVAFLALTAGCLAAVRLAGVRASGSNGGFVFGWGITEISYRGAAVVYPGGDLYIVRQAGGQEIQPGSVVLFTAADRSGVSSGFVAAREDGAFLVDGEDGNRVRVPIADVLCVYKSRIEGFAGMLKTLGSPVSLVVYALVLAGSIIMWKRLPGRKADSEGLCPADAEISSNLY